MALSFSLSLSPPLSLSLAFWSRITRQLQVELYTAPRRRESSVLSFVSFCVLFFFCRKGRRREKREIRANEQRSRSWTKRPFWAPEYDWSALSPRPEAQRRSQPRGSTGRRSIHRLAPPLEPVAWREEIAQRACAGFSSRFASRID